MIVLYIDLCLLIKYSESVQLLCVEKNRGTYNILVRLHSGLHLSSAVK